MITARSPFSIVAFDLIAVISSNDCIYAAKPRVTFLKPNAFPYMP